jgi:hypothetical protein
MIFVLLTNHFFEKWVWPMLFWNPNSFGLLQLFLKKTLELQSYAPATDESLTNKLDMFF